MEYVHCDEDTQVNSFVNNRKLAHSTLHEHGMNE